MQPSIKKEVVKTTIPIFDHLSFSCREWRWFYQKKTTKKKHVHTWLQIKMSYYILKEQTTPGVKALNNS